jgi:transposase
MAATLGFVPKHAGTSGKIRLRGISKRGDRYLRSFLIHGARSVITHNREKQDPVSRWVHRLVERRGMHKAVVALANKNARVAFALIHEDQPYDVTKMCRAA